MHNSVTTLDHATVFPLKGEAPERLEALKAKLGVAKSDEQLLRVVTSGKLLTMPEAFQQAAAQARLFDGMAPDEEKRVRIRAEYPADVHVAIDTAAGAVRGAAVTRAVKKTLSAHGFIPETEIIEIQGLCAHCSAR